MGLRPICCGIALGTNSSPLPALPSDGEYRLLSTVTITVNEPADTVRFMTSIWSQTSESTVSSTPPRGNVVQYLIIRLSDNHIIGDVLNTDFDEMTTTFTAFDDPGAGRFFIVYLDMLCARLYLFKQKLYYQLTLWPRNLVLQHKRAPFGNA